MARNPAETRLRGSGFFNHSAAGPEWIFNCFWDTGCIDGFSSCFLGVRVVFSKLTHQFFILLNSALSESFQAVFFAGFSTDFEARQSHSSET